MNNFSHNNFTELSLFIMAIQIVYLPYLDCLRIKVLSYHTFLAFGISCLKMLTRSSDWIFNPKRFTGLLYSCMHEICYTGSTTSC